MDLEILEALALSDDRSAALAQLLPGSAEHDYYRALQLQHGGKLDEVDPILARWNDRHGRDQLSIDLLRRQQLYRALADGAGRNPSVDKLRDEFGISHQHQAEVEQVDPTRQTRITDGAYDPTRLLQEAAQHDANLNHVTDEGIAQLVDWKLEPGRRRALLARLGHTPNDAIVALIADDLDYRGSNGFGSLAAHSQLTLAQLHALAARRPELRSHTGWVSAVVARMQPANDVDLEHDLDARAAFLVEVWGFVGDLPPAANSLKAHVLWHLLDTQRRRDLPLDRDLVRAYLGLPRQAPYAIEPRVLDKDREAVVRFGLDYGQATRLPAAGSDEELIRDAIQRDPEAAERFAPWLERSWLELELATAQLLAGATGDAADRATRVLGPARAAALRERVELAWCPHNPTQLAADAPVALDVLVKHVGELLVKVFRIDPLAYFQHNRREVDPQLDLDGLAASHEQTLTFSEPAIRRVRRRIELPSCGRPGTYVVDLIGNGTASRAVIRKGRLRHTLRTGAAGQVVTILDDAGLPRPDARAWIGDREYTPDADAQIVVPFSTQPGRTPMLLSAGDLASVAQLAIGGEDAQLSLALALDRQSLTAGRTARAVARLGLAIGGAPASLALLKQASWDVVLTDRHGVATSKSFPLVLDDDAAAVLEWPLGDDLAELAISVRGKLDVRSTQREQDLAVRRQLSVARMYADGGTEAMYLAETAGGWVLSALGKGGEPRAQRPVSVGLTHRWAGTELQAELATDARGRVELGALPGVRQIRATLGGLTQIWGVDAPALPPVSLYATAGEGVIVHLPATRAAADVLPRLSLVEIRGRAPAHHVVADLEPLEGALALRGLAPGEYQLRAPGLPVTTIYVTAALPQVGDWAIATREQIEVPRFAPAIAAITVDNDLVIQLRGAGDATRVHVIATRFLPAPVEALVDGPSVAPRWRADSEVSARYVAGRELGDEYRYVLERRAQPRYPGLMLDRPSLLLNPWSRRSTNTQVMSPMAGGGYPAMAAASPAFGGAAPGGARGGGGAAASDPAFAGYDFVPEPPAVRANLVPDEAGAVRVPRGELAGASSVWIIVDDPAGRSERRIALPEPPLAPRELRLMLALAPERHATQRKAITPLAAGGQLVIEDRATAQIHLLDSVGRAHAYLLALQDNATLREFEFITRWHALDAAARRTLYSKHACHELHLFLYFKDRAFFDDVIRPYLAHKRTKTFVDHWLLDAELTRYTDPAELVRLNAVERALLAWRLTGDDALPRILADEIANQAPDVARDGRLIDALLGARALDGDDRLKEAQSRPAMDESVVAFDQEDDGDFGAEAPGEPMYGSAPAMPRARASRPPPAPMAKKMMKGAGAGGPRRLSADVASRADVAPMFRAADKTQEWAEHNWWQRRPSDSRAAMIAANRLWRDLAHHRGAGKGFLSPWLGLATGSFAEAMVALAVIDLPFVAGEHAITQDGPRLTVIAAGNALAGTSQLIDAPLTPGGAPLVVGMTYVRADDRYQFVDGQRLDRYVDTFTVGVVYLCQIVLANPSSQRQQVSALIQIPRGSIAVAAGVPTRTIDVVLPPYGTHGHEVQFYWPAPGAWSQFPVHVSRAGAIVAAGAPRTIDVQTGEAAPDHTSWSFVSQRAALADVVAYLATANLAAIDLARVAWRLRDAAAYHAILGALEARRVYHAALWAYAFKHGDTPRIRTWLRERAMAGDALGGGPVLDMLGLDDEALGSYEHLELAPLTNARAHRLGGKLVIANDGLAAQYTRFLALVAHRARPTAEELLAATHYLLVQDRIAPAIATLARVDAGQLADRMQYDLVTAYVACLTGDLPRAREVAARWADHPVDRWRHRFGALAQLLAELDGAAPAAVDPRSRDQQQAELAARQPAFELAVDREAITVHSQHVSTLELRLFEMDIELLFSRQPFVQSDVSRFSFIEPGHREAIANPPPELAVAWPARLRGKNVVVEAVGAGLRKAVVHYANDLITNLSNQYGQLRVLRATDRAPLPATYVKVYARKRGGAVEFYKDGYTDLRGWFDYATLSTTDLDQVERFAILVSSDAAGAAILEAAPPAR